MLCIMPKGLYFFQIIGFYLESQDHLSHITEASLFDLDSFISGLVHETCVSLAVFLDRHMNNWMSERS